MLQVLGVAIAAPLVVLAIYLASTGADQPPFYLDKERMDGFSALAGTALLFAPWIAMSALMRQRDETVRSQAVVFERERSAMERQALDARLRLLQAQVEPHFLFNTLANVRELVESGSPQASAVLGSLIAYLRAAVPRLQEPATTLGQELELVRAYLELMHMRMPDRLQFEIHADEETLAIRCPPMTLLTLVENSVRHGIDPSEEGGRIEVRVRVRDGRCRVQVIDTGSRAQARERRSRHRTVHAARAPAADFRTRRAVATHRARAARRSRRSRLSRLRRARHDCPASDGADRRRRTAAA